MAAGAHNNDGGGSNKDCVRVVTDMFLQGNGLAAARGGCVACKGMGGVGAATCLGVKWASCAPAARPTNVARRRNCIVPAFAPHEQRFSSRVGTLVAHVGSAPRSTTEANRITSWWKRLRHIGRSDEHTRRTDVTLGPKILSKLEPGGTIMSLTMEQL